MAPDLNLVDGGLSLPIIRIGLHFEIGAFHPLFESVSAGPVRFETDLCRIGLLGGFLVHDKIDVGKPGRTRAPGFWCG